MGADSTANWSEKHGASAAPPGQWVPVSLTGSRSAEVASDVGLPRQVALPAEPDTPSGHGIKFGGTASNSDFVEKIDKPLEHYSKAYQLQQKAKESSESVDDLVSNLSRKLTNVQLDGQGRIHAFDTDESNDSLISEFSDPWTRNSIKTALNHSNLDYVKTALVKCRKYLSIDLKYDAVWLNIDTVLQMDVLGRLFELLVTSNDDILQYEACWVITNIAAGTSDHCRVILEFGFVPVLVKLCSSSNAAVRVQAAWALGNMAGDGAVFRDAILDAGAVTPLTELWQHAEDSFYYRQGMSIAIWVLSNMARWRHFDWSKLAPAFPLLKSVLLTCQDIEIVTETTWAICRILHEQTNIDELVDEEMCLKLMQLCAVGDDNVGMLTPALRALTNITYGSDSATQCILDNGGLDLLQSLLRSSHTLVCNEAAMSISNFFAGTPRQLDSVISSTLFDVLVQRLAGKPDYPSGAEQDKLHEDGPAPEWRGDEWKLKKELVYGLSNGFSSKSGIYVSRLVDSGAIQPLFTFLKQALVYYPTEVASINKALELLCGVLELGAYQQEHEGLANFPYFNQFVVAAKGFAQLLTLSELAQQRAGELAHTQPNSAKKANELNRLSIKMRETVEAYSFIVNGNVQHDFVGQTAIEELAGIMGNSLKPFT